jgi:excinuclease UvrABC nuclease subunit
MAAPDDRKAIAAAALPRVHTWTGRPQPDQLAPLPGCPAVLLFVDEAEKPVQLLTTQQLKRLVTSRLSEPPEPRRGRADLAAVVRGVRWRPTHSPFEARWWYYRLARVLHPREYRKLVSFGPAWFLQANWAEAVPELRVTERVWCLEGEFVGPWPAQRSCRQALEGLWDLFELCRYPEQIRKAPAGSPCAYADMGRCDAPCNGSVPLKRYADRMHSAWRFAQGGVAAWIHSATERMKQAAGEQRYELAGQLKQQLEFARSWQQHWSPTVYPARDMNLLLVIPATRRKAWKLFLFRQGHLTDGPLLSQRKLPTETTAWLTEQLSQPVDTLTARLDDVVRMEQTWLVAHFLQHKAARTALIEYLPDATVPPDLEASLRDVLEHRQRTREAPENTTEET